MLEHSKECQEMIEQSLADIKAWEKMWPDHCKYCGGWGGFSSPGSSVPYGNTWVSLPDDYDVCEHCMEMGKCPRCGKDTFPIDDATVDQPEVCSSCGYDVRNADGCPPEAECICWKEHWDD